MNSEHKQSDQHLESVLDFLSKEIAATSEPVQGQESQADDIDSVVSKLLQQVVHESEGTAEKGLPEAPRNSIQSMLAGMAGYEELKANPQGIFEESVSRTAGLPEAVRHENGAAGKNNVRQFPMEKPQGQFSNPSVEPPPVQPPVEEPLPAPYAVPASTAEVKAAAPQVPAAREQLKPAKSNALIIALGGLAAVLAIAGVYFFFGHNGSEAGGLNASLPLDSTESAANAPAIAPAPPAMQNAATIRDREAASAVPASGKPMNEDAGKRTPSAAASMLPQNASAEIAESNIAVSAVAQTTAGSPVPVGAAVPQPPSESVPAFSLPALPQGPQAQVTPPVMITAPTAMPIPAKPAAKPKVAVSEELVQAVAVQKVAPVYPELAKKYKITGTVTLNVQISETGKVTQAAVVNGPAMLHAAALAAVRQWLFKPASLNGNNVSSSGTVSIVFNTPR